MPETEQSGIPPRALEVAARAIILKQVVVYALIAPPREMLAEIMQRWPAHEQNQFRRDGEAKREEFWASLGPLRSRLSPSEKQFASSTMLTMTERQQADASWRVEAFQVLYWALCLRDQLPAYDTQADHDQLRAFPPCEPEEFLRTATLLPRETVRDARDVAELWHWRSRTRQLVEDGETLPQSADLVSAGLRTYDDVVRLTAVQANQNGRLGQVADDDFVARGKPYRTLDAEEWSIVSSITKERHFALNWLCGYAPGNRWDDTPIDT